jgi:hypothetical protein
LASAFLTGRVWILATQAGMARPRHGAGPGGARALADQSVNRELNDPSEVQPTAKRTSVTVRSPRHSSPWPARSGASSGSCRASPRRQHESCGRYGPATRRPCAPAPEHPAAWRSRGPSGHGPGAAGRGPPTSHDHHPTALGGAGVGAVEAWLLERADRRGHAPSTAAGRTIRVLPRPRLPHRCPSTRPAGGSADWPTEALNHSHEHHHLRLDH